MREVAMQAMRVWTGLCVGAALLATLTARGQETAKVSTQWEELTAADFVTGMHQAEGVCLLPFGILEKHGPHLPIGTDLINARWVAQHAAAEEYAVVFPAYYFGQIDEAKHQPGTMAYSRHMQLDLLQETTDEMARNGCKKVLIVNGHGGNLELLPYFAQTELQEQHDYVVYVYWWDKREGAGRPKQQTTVDMHAGESETANTLVSRPDLVHMDRAEQESGADQARLHLPGDVYTGIWWYARFPNHYSGDGGKATQALGEWDMKAWVQDLVAAIKAVKADDESLKLQTEFYEESKHPLDTKQ
jgi:creatinine amidohydrolase